MAGYGGWATRQWYASVTGATHCGGWHNDVHDGTVKKREGTVMTTREKTRPQERPRTWWIGYETVVPDHMRGVDM
ncbi:hypothetical protein SESBI_21209 [Sesbania bispinosa]|nr:hypothetical protein SESBI_21209 [Sesbania bispinosa]